MRAIIAAVLLAALLMVPFILQRGTINQLRAENRSLSQRVAQLTGDLAEVNQSKTARATNSSTTLAREQLHELMRLRAEVSELRRKTNAPAASQAAGGNVPATPSTNAPIQAGTLQSSGQGTNAIMKGPWRNAGFAQPANAAQTLIWSAHAGTVETMLSAMTPELQAETQQLIASGAQTGEDLKRWFTAIYAMRPSPQHQTTESEAFFIGDSARSEISRAQPGDHSALNTTANRQQVLRFQKVSDQWLYAGRVEH